MPGAVRIGDVISCGDVVAEGSGNVFVNGIPISRVNSDLTAGHCYTPTIIIPSGGNLGTVFVNNIPVAIVGDTISHCCPPSCHIGTIIVGSPNTSIY